MARIDAMFQKMVKDGASDLHLTVGNKPLIREKGALKPLAELILTKEMLESLLYETMNDAQWTQSMTMHDFDYAYEVPGLARFRGNIFFNQQGIAAVFRTIPTIIKTAAELGMPKTVADMGLAKKGLVLVTGPTGSGKSTTLAAIINIINETRDANILTIEDPIEFVHQPKRCKITQREVHRDTHNFKAALRSSMRQDPDVILVGEMRDYETISLALTAAEMGILVFGTLHTNSAAKTVDRIINVYPSDERDSARGLLAGAVRGIVAQQLCPTKDGKGRCAAVEVLSYHPSLPNLIRAGKAAAILSLMETSGSLGMQTMDMCLERFYKEGKITAKTAYLKSLEKKRFAAFMEEEEEAAPTH
ncbi:MAG TPA: type IV pilus twitching motility protein PilT [bacterium]|jgi:twitching motility protein PilT|nr:type IV pilus twitching motility protein PilT [bacterium]